MAITSQMQIICHLSLTVRRDVQENDEEAVRVKEQSILELGTLLAKTGQAAGNVKTFPLCLFKDTVISFILGMFQHLFF